MMSRLGHLSMGLIAVGFLSLCAGCSGSVSELSGPPGGSPEAGPPSDPADAFAFPEASPDADTTDSPVDSGPEAGTEQKACIDIHVSAELLGDPIHWDEHAMAIEPYYALQEQVFATDSTIYVVWKAKKRAIAGQESASARQLNTSAFDSFTGTHLKTAPLAPTSTRNLHSYDQLLASDDQGNYALLLTWNESISGRPINVAQKLVVGKLDGSVETLFGDPWDDTVRPLYSTISWDGQAFVLHGFNAGVPLNDKKVVMLRVAANGSVLTPATFLSLPQIQTEANSLVPSLAALTDATTGRTVILRDDDHSHQWALVHERDGSLVTEGDSFGWNAVSNAPIFGRITGIGTARYLAWSWTQSKDMRLVSLDSQFVPQQSEITLPFPASSDTSLHYPPPQGVLDWQHKWHWVLARHNRLEAQSWVPGQPPESVPLLDYVPACAEDAGSCDSSLTPYNKGIRVVTQNGSVWVGVRDQLPPVLGQEPTLFYRVLRVSEGCNYPINLLPSHDH